MLHKYENIANCVKNVTQFMNKPDIWWDQSTYLFYKIFLAETVPRLMHNRRSYGNVARPVRIQPRRDYPKLPPGNVEYFQAPFDRPVRANDLLTLRDW